MTEQVGVQPGRCAVVEVGYTRFLRDTPWVLSAGTAAVAGRGALERKDCLQREEHWWEHMNYTLAREELWLQVRASAAE